MNGHYAYVIYTRSSSRSDLFYHSSSLGMLDSGASYGFSRLGSPADISTFFIYFYSPIYIFYFIFFHYLIKNHSQYPQPNKPTYLPT